MLISLLSLLFCYVESSIEVKYGDKHGLLSNIILSLIILLFFLVPLLFNGFYFGGVIYVGIRLALFDYMFSYKKYNQLFYLGNTSFTDKILKKIPKSILLSLRIIILVATVTFEIYNF